MNINGKQLHELTRTRSLAFRELTGDQLRQYENGGVVIVGATTQSGRINRINVSYGNEAITIRMREPGGDLTFRVMSVTEFEEGVLRFHCGSTIVNAIPRRHY